MTKLERPVVLITGASTGLGLAIAKKLISENRYHVILTSKASSIGRFRLHNLHEGVNLWIRPMDVTILFQREKVIKEALIKLGRFDYLINNAGVAYRTVCEHIEPNDLIQQMNINLHGPLELIRLVLPIMRQQKSGHIINVSSVSGMMAMPTMGLYSASKFALEGLTESLWHELRPWGINVTLVQPGFIKSDAFSKVPWTRKANVVNNNQICPYHEHYSSMSSFIETLMGKVRITPEGVALKVSNLMNQKYAPLRLKVTLDAKLFAMLRKILPARFYLWLLHSHLPSISKWGKSTYKESIFANFRKNKSPQSLEEFGKPTFL